MSYKFNFNTLPFRAVIPAAHTPIKYLEPDPVIGDQLHTHIYIQRKVETLPDNCTAVYHTSDGDWLELDVGPESMVGQREMPDIKILGIEKILHA